MREKDCRRCDPAHRHFVREELLSPALCACWGLVQVYPVRLVEVRARECPCRHVSHLHDVPEAVRARQRLDDHLIDVSSSRILSDDVIKH